MKILELEQIEKANLQQKVKIKWIIDGDEKSKFFHEYLKNKNRKSRLHGLTINGHRPLTPSTSKGCLCLFSSISKKSS